MLTFPPKTIAEPLRRLAARVRFTRRCRKHPGFIVLRPGGLEVQHYQLHGTDIRRELCWSVRWTDIHRIVAYKVDCLAFDCICLQIDLPHTSYRLPEDMEGFDALRESLPQHFDGLATDWWERVVLPPFETCLTTVWEPSKAAEQRIGGDEWRQP
ncbi:MAG: hypothetical protein AB2L07_08660 [Thermoanaerobaculaceae bacterium]